MTHGTEDAASHRAAIRARARVAGMLVVPEQTSPTPTRAEALAATAGAGSAVSEALAEERESR